MSRSPFEQSDNISESIEAAKCTVHDIPSAQLPQVIITRWMCISLLVFACAVTRGNIYKQEHLDETTPALKKELETLYENCCSEFGITPVYVHADLSWL